MAVEGITAPAASSKAGMQSDPSPHKTKTHPGLGVAPGRADRAGGMRTAGDLARSDRLAADDVQYLGRMESICPTCQSCKAAHCTCPPASHTCRPRDAGGGRLGHGRGAGVLRGGGHGRGRFRLGLPEVEGQRTTKSERPTLPYKPLNPKPLNLGPKHEKKRLRLKRPKKTAGSQPSSSCLWRLGCGAQSWSHPKGL